ncbi:MAG: alpha/beta hydrolase [Dyadobacter sp.]|uniref:alpha/beta hydrolase family protein n=1 Tax=Dyadobacter sp. TaxID=1914288 RepID=UPI003264B7B7
MKSILVFLIFCLLTMDYALAQSSIDRKTMVYATKDGVPLELDKYVDNSVAYPGKRPVMIYVHGGGFSTGSRVNALQIQYGKHFVDQGFVTILINYRLGLKGKVKSDQAAALQDLSDPATTLAAVNMASEDLIEATAFILSKAGEWNIDTKKIIISGGSAGAIACLNAEYSLCSGGVSASRLPAGFNYAGLVSHAGLVMTTQDTLIWKKSPCPMLLMHGDQDQQVTFNSLSVAGNFYAGSNYIHKQLVKINASHWLYQEAGADHIVALKPLQYNFDEIDTFIDKFIMKGQQAVVHTIWADTKPDSMQIMMQVVPLYITGWDKTGDEVNKK